MGLTIHYKIRSTARSEKKLRELVEKMRQLALDLPFESVGDVLELDNPDHEKSDDALRWLLIQSQGSVQLNANTLTCVNPKKLFAITVVPGAGCEDMNLGLCSYPREIQVDGRTVKTGLSGYRWNSFCKTQYASDPECGGLPHFLRCHISCITLLERIAELPMIDVEINDEGKYGPANYSDDWKEAREAGREPTYVDHLGKYNVKALAEEIGEWNEMIAAFGGALKDTVAKTGMSVESPITSYSNFEELEFRGSNDANILPFLMMMKEITERNNLRENK